MVIRFLFLISLFFAPFTMVYAQYTEVINANRPGVSQGAFSVGRNVFQIETGVSLGKEKHSLKNSETDGLGIDYAIRAGLFSERLEFSLIGEYQSNSTVYNGSTTTHKVANFKSNTLGVKYLLYDPNIKGPQDPPSLYSWRANHRFTWFDLLPAISLYGGFNIDNNAYNPLIPHDIVAISPKFGFTAQHNWRGGWVLVTNVYLDRFFTKAPSFGYIATLTHATHSHFSLFVENQGIKSDFYSDQLLRGGAAALFSPNFQVDLSLTYSFKDTPSKFYGRIGLAYRVDFHYKNEYIEFVPPKRVKKKDKEDKKSDDEPDATDKN